MAINFTTTNPLDGTTLVTSDLAKSAATAIDFQIQSTNTFSSNSLVVRINGEVIIVDGNSVAGSRFNSTILSTSNTITVSNIIFLSASDSFESFETVEVNVESSDNDGAFDQSFTFRIIDTIAPELNQAEPSGTIDNALDTPIYFTITDQGSGVDPSTLTVSANIQVGASIVGEDVILAGNFQSGYTGSITQNQTDLEVFFTRDLSFPSDAEITINIAAQDEANLFSDSFSFDIIDSNPPEINNLIPAQNAINIAETSTISLTFSDQNGSGINLEQTKITLNGLDAVSAGELQLDTLDGSSQRLITYFPLSTEIESVTYVLKTINDLDSARPVNVVASTKDNRRNQTSLTYQFNVRDYLPPRIEKTFPADNDQNILPSTDIRFKLIEEQEGYGVNFSSLVVEIDGYSPINHTRLSNPVDGYIDDFIGRTFEQFVLDGDGYTPQAFTDDAYQILTYPGYQLKIEQLVPREYCFTINPEINFDYLQTVPVKIVVEDRGGNLQSDTYFFTTAEKDQIITTASPDTGTFSNFIDGYSVEGANRFLYTQGIEFSTNIGDTTTYYTTDGSVPMIDRYNKVVGTTQVYTKPVLINKEGLNVVKYFSIDQAGNKESVKQETYMIDILPPEISEITSTPIAADIPLATTIIPIETTALFSQGETVRILDDAIPPIITKILTLNTTSNPPFIIVENPVAKLKVERNARVEKATQPINPSSPIEFDTKSIPEFLYIGSDGNQQQQADAVFEQFRILNKASTDEEILADFTLLSKGSKFFNQDDPVVLGSEFSDLEKQRVNLPNDTLVLLDFDGNVLNAPRQGVLASNTVQIVDVNAAANDVIFTIKIKEGEQVDRELLREVLTDFAPTDLNIIVRYQEIS